eukprot:4304289-Pyramimonas_sp.AAC.1
MSRYSCLSGVPTPPKSEQISIDEYKQRERDLGETAHVGLEYAEKDEYGASLIKDGDDGEIRAPPIELARRLEEYRDTGP